MKEWRWKKMFALCAALAAAAGSGMLLRWDREPAVKAFHPARDGAYTLILDAGHGGEDGGAVSVTGAKESDINLAIVLRLDQLLGLYGTAPVLVRQDDRSVYGPGCETLRQKKVSDLHNRVALIDATPNAFVLSIHQNTFSDPSFHGAQVFYRQEERSRALARSMQEVLREKLDPGNKRESARMASSVYIMQKITCPGVLIECGFLSHPEEEARLRDEGYQTKLAACLAACWLRRGEIEGSQSGISVL